MLFISVVTHHPFHFLLLQAIALLIMNEGESAKQKDGLGLVDQDLPHVDEDLPDVECIDIDAEPDVILFHLSKVEEQFSTTNHILDWVRDHKDFKCLRSWSARGNSPLSGDQMDELLDPAVVDWNKFRRDVIKAFSDNKATSKNNKSSRAAAYMADTTELQTALSKKFIPSMDSPEKQQYFRCCVFTLSCTFVRRLQNRAKEVQTDLSERIDKILVSDWAPSDDTHCETLYNIAGAMLIGSRRKSEQQNTPLHLRPALRKLHQLNSITQDDAKVANLPIGRVAAEEVKHLTYVTRQFYELTCKFESVISSLLNEKEIVKYGSDILQSIKIVLSRKLSDSLKALFREENEEEDYFDFVQPTNDDLSGIANFLLNYYTNLRGKDWVRKKNAQHINHTETHRAKLGVQVSVTSLSVLDC